MASSLARNRAVWSMAAAPLALFAPPANGETGLDINGIDFDAGATEIQFETRILDTDAGNGLKLELQAEHGLGDRWTFGGEIEFDREPGQPLRADQVVARLKWHTPRRGNRVVAFGLRLGAGYDFQKRAAVVEAAPYVGWSNDDWSVVGRFDVRQLLRNQAEPKVGYRLRLTRALGSDIELGVESDGDVSVGADPKHRIGPFIDMPLGGESAPRLELGAFAGLTRDTPDMQYRVEIEFEF